jgi:hypothetical protein
MLSLTATAALIVLSFPTVLPAQETEQATQQPVALPKPAPGKVEPGVKTPVQSLAKASAGPALVTASTPESPIPEGTESSLSMPLKISLTPSETPIKLGLTSNIAALIQNVSSKPVIINLSSLQLTTHSIVAAHASRCVTALPASFNIMGASKTQEGYFFVTLQPEDQVSGLFNLSQGTDAFQDSSDPAVKKQIEQWKAACSVNRWDRIQQALDFTPGNYDYYMTGYFFANNAANVPTLRTFSTSATFPVGIDQTTVIFFAVIGGWLALLVVAFTNAGNDDSFIGKLKSVDVEGTGLKGLYERVTSSVGFHAVLHFVAQAAGVAILSAAFTIVSSRWSDSQLPVKISILDAWGAMTIGFLSYFVGKKFIGALTAWGNSSPADPNQKTG